MTTAQQIHSSKPKRVNYSPRTAIVTTFARSQSGTRSLGERVVVFQWDDGTITAKHCKGSGWRGPQWFLYDERTLASADDISAYAQERLAR